MLVLKQIFTAKKIVLWLISAVIIAGVSLTICGYFLLFTSSHSKAADLGQFGDYFAGMLNPFFGLLTTFFAFFAYRNTQEQLMIQKEESLLNTYNFLLQSFSADLDKIIKNFVYIIYGYDNYVLGTHEFSANNLNKDAIFTGLEAMTKYHRYLQTQVDLIQTESKDEQPSKQKCQIICNEINRVRTLIKGYEIRFSRSSRDDFSEHLRMTLPSSIISCFMLMSALELFLIKDNKTSIWIKSIELDKYLTQ